MLAMFSPSHWLLLNTSDKIWITTLNQIFDMPYAFLQVRTTALMKEQTSNLMKSFQHNYSN